MDAMHTENVSLRRNVEKLQAENRTLRKRLEKYERPKKNSNNSSTPPSKEPFKDEALERMRKGLFKCMDYIFNFLENPRIPSDQHHPIIVGWEMAYGYC